MNKPYKTHEEKTSVICITLKNTVIDYLRDKGNRSKFIQDLIETSMIAEKDLDQVELDKNTLKKIIERLF